MTLPTLAHFGQTFVDTTAAPKNAFLNMKFKIFCKRPLEIENIDPFWTNICYFRVKICEDHGFC